MKIKLILSIICLFCSGYLFSQKVSLDESVYDRWRNIEKCIVSDDADLVLTEYMSHSEKEVLVISIESLGFKKEIVGGKTAQLYGKKNSAHFFVKDTLFLLDGTNGSVVKLGLAKVVTSESESDFVTWFREEKFYISSGNITDSLSNVKKGVFAGPEKLALLCESDSTHNHIVTVNLNKKRLFARDTLYSSKTYISALTSDSKGENLLFFDSSDSSFLTDVQVLMINLKSADIIYTGLNQPLLPENMAFNVKKGISFSVDNKHFKFDISPIDVLIKKKTPKKKEEKPPFEYELWRWNDTLLPSQKTVNSHKFAENVKCAYYPDNKKFVRLSLGKGVFLMAGEKSPFCFELDDTPFLYEDLWKDPLPKEFYLINANNGEYSLLYEKFFGSFAISPISSHLFTYEYDTEKWFVTDLNTLQKTTLSASMKYPVKNNNFDKPQPASAYGQAGISSDGKYFIVYDEFDIWALPISGDKDPWCITGEFGRENNIKFKVLNISGERGRPEGVDLKSPIILQSVNLNNMHSGFYRVEKGGKPEKLLEGPYKYNFSKNLKNNYLIRRESFNEAPDYWLTDKDFKPERRVTDLNNQLSQFKTGISKVIEWRDSSGTMQRGVLYTPEDYDPAKRYPAIVYLYETMTQDVFTFYPPEPTTSTVNPLMMVSRGYVIFMPDIKYEIGWPGRSSFKITESGTRHIIESGIADPQRIGIQGHSWGGYQVGYIITQTNLYKCACTETAVTNMISAYTGLRAGAGKPRMFMYESTQSRIGGTLWDKQENYIKNSSVFYLDRVTTPLLSRHSDGDEAVPYTQGLELFLGLKRLGKPVWMFNYKGDGHNIKKREIAVDWSRRMYEFFDYYLIAGAKPEWM